ncbi:PREDICTED: stromal cell-derived factor 2-like protein 1 [Charadrius vociferus]|uniref:stromal cell-derived factor 2-like protein 1 n=1 Tax=Charadrius vociferus TaxID=50402 RepID=UPI0005219E2B|nr:PREDICTED: stromal cell-derived factor 2-like protein 1 [Charadrius vociferus]
MAGGARWRRRTILEVAEVRVPGAGGAAGPGWGCGALEAWQGEEDAEAWGSGQQSVTGVEASDDANSYWRIRGKNDGSCQRGTPVKCGQAIRLTHVNTGKNLHTHHFPSPLSNNQEVSAFGDDGEGDDLDIWIVQCSGTYWEREDAVRFKHVGTEVFLSITGEQYGHPIRGQREVHGMSTANHHNYWKAMEGVFIKPSMDPAKHDEL